MADRKHRPESMAAWLDDLGLPPKPVSLPPLATLANAQPPREGNAPWLAGGLIALAAGVFWWAQSNSELVERLGAQLAAGVAALHSPAGHQLPVKAAASLTQPMAPQVTPPAPQPLPAPAMPKAASSAASLAPVAAASHEAPSHALPAARETAASVSQRVPPSPARIELAADTLEVAPLQPAASVVVHRRHDYHNGVSFSWWTESGTAKPGLDFVPVKPRTDYIPAGESETHLLIPIVADPRRQLAKTFYVVVGDPSDDATLGSRTITMVTIPAVN